MSAEREANMSATIITLPVVRIERYHVPTGPCGKEALAQLSLDVFRAEVARVMNIPPELVGNGRAPNVVSFPRRRR